MLGRPPFFPSEALAGPASKLLIFYHYLFVFYTLRSWKQQCRGEALLPAAQTRALLPDYDRNRWREPNRQSLQTRRARVRPVIPVCFVFGPSRVFLFHTDPRERRQNQRRRQPQEPLQRFHHAVSSYPSTRGQDQTQNRWSDRRNLDWEARNAVCCCLVPTENLTVLPGPTVFGVGTHGSGWMLPPIHTRH